MIGLPKTFTDFSQYESFFPPQKKWRDCFEKQIQTYLQNQDFFTKKKEEWKHFPFQKILQPDFFFGENSSSLLKDNSSPYLSPSFFISVKNGKAFPSFKPEENGISIYSWKELILSQDGLHSKIKEKILSSLKKERNPFCSLSNVLAEDGMILIIKEKLEKPLEIHYTHSNEHDQQGLNVRNFIFLENCATAQILEIFYGRTENKPLFFNIQTDCFVSKEAVLEHSRIDQAGVQDILINQLFADLAESAKACFFSLSLNAQVSRCLSDLKQSANSCSEIGGLSLLEGNKYADHRVSVVHKGQKGVSSQFYKSILFDSSKQIFRGFTSIEQKAQKSFVKQLSKNLLFGKRAFAMAFPELDITADDVQASHGAVFSPFNENKELIFYLQSRGVDIIPAFYLLLNAFIRDVFSPLQLNTKELIQSLTQEKLNSLGNEIRQSIL